MSASLETLLDNVVESSVALSTMKETQRGGTTNVVHKHKVDRDPLFSLQHNEVDENVGRI